MPTPTYNLIQEIIVSGSVTTSVSFTAIPSTYDDLVVVCRARNSLADRTIMRFNSDSGTNYARIFSNANGGTQSTGSSTTDTYINCTGADGSTNHQFKMSISGYANTNWRTVSFMETFTELGGTNNTITYNGNQWFNTSIVTTITISTLAASSFVANSIFQLYGIKGSN